MNANGSIGVFDSGVGGLSVWREIVRHLPHENTIYFADRGHVPYGSKPQTEIQRYCTAIARFLLEQECKAIVVACNTASAAALKYLRETFPELVIIGMEPAVKPAAALTRTGVVGVMATPATFEGRMFQATAGRHAYAIKLINQVCDGLADLVETLEVDSARTETALRAYLEPILATNADVIVLACTHYPFVLDTIQRIVGDEIKVLDPAPAVARHLGRVLAERNLATSRDIVTGTHGFYTSGDAASFATALRRLVGVSATTQSVSWISADLVVECANSSTFAIG
ncbi:MAG: glutamate racemase [Gammaproteobacteria bacterium]|nr:glutamate racemase [Gammaproteobacteria bacterium]